MTMRTLLAALLLASPVLADEPPTYADDVAPILHQNCATCHRPNAVGPFPLLSYADAKKRARAIAEVAADGSMPPWKPVAGHGTFRDARTLTEPQKDTLRKWLDAGTPRGDPAREPKPPVFHDGWQLGTPDLVLKMPKPFTVPAEGRDLYMHFPLPVPMDGEEVYINAVEVRPGNLKVAHHAIGILDANRVGRTKVDPATGGYESFAGAGFLPAGLTPGYVPGQTPRRLGDGVAITLRKGTDLVLQMHYHPVGSPQTDRTEVGLYLTKKKPTRHVLGVLMGTLDLDIPPGEKKYTRGDRFVLPVDMKLGSAWAHMHLIGKEIKVWALLPDHKVEKLLKIEDWDFNWQDTYIYEKEVLLPKGTVLRAEFTFDNSAENPRNPNDPPARILNGENSTDEMGGLWLGGEVASEADLWKLLGANVFHHLEIESKKAR